MSDAPSVFGPDRDGRRYWEAAQEGRLEIQRCSECGTWRWPARAICNRCHSFEATWEVASGRGRIVSWVVTHQPFAPAFRDRLPYVVASVALEEQADVVLLGNLLGGAPRDGLPVRAVFPVFEDGVRRLQWEPAP